MQPPLAESSVVQTARSSRRSREGFRNWAAFRAEKHDTYRHLNEFVSFDIEGAWMDDEDVMGVQER